MGLSYGEFCCVFIDFKWLGSFCCGEFGIWCVCDVVKEIGYVEYWWKNMCRWVVLVIDFCFFNGLLVFCYYEENECGKVWCFSVILEESCLNI